MPLMIDLKPGEKIILNGVVLENAGGNTKLRVLNESNILRQKEIVTEEDAATPAARVYFCLQCAYIFPDQRSRFLGAFEMMLSEYVAACPSASDLAAEIRTQVVSGHYYKALKLSRSLLKHESTVLEPLRDVSAATD